MIRVSFFEHLDSHELVRLLLLAHPGRGRQPPRCHHVLGAGHRREQLVAANVVAAEAAPGAGAAAAALLLLDLDVLAAVKGAIQFSVNIQ